MSSDLRRTWFVLALAFAACGPRSGGKAGGTGDNGGGTPIDVVAVTDASWVSCPPGLDARYRGMAARYKLHDLRVRGCLRGRFGDANLAAFLDAHHLEPEPGYHTSYTAVVLLDDDGAEKAKGELGPFDVEHPAAVRYVVDLDGDGVDEIVSEC